MTTSRLPMAAAARSDTAPPFQWSPVLAVALSTFIVITAEMMPVGILTPIADALDIGAGVAGTSLAITGIVAAVVAALAPLISGRINRRTLLAAFLLLLAVANVAAALATSFAVFAVARVAIGISMGIVWANAGGLGPRISDPAHIGRAMTTIFSGVSVGMVLGLPAGTFIAAIGGWRAAFWAVAVLGLLAAVFVRVALPSLPVAERQGLNGIFRPWGDRGVRAGFVITALVVIGHFAAYTFIRPVLETNDRNTPLLIVAALAVYGLAGIFGNFVIGWAANKSPRRALLISLGTIVVGAAAVPFTVDHTWLLFVALVLWGAAYGGIGVATQAWIRIANPGMIELSAAMLSGVFNGSIAVGSFAGGIVFDAFGGTPIMLIGAAVVALGLVVVATAQPLAVEHRRRPHA